jgi:hypothetical protein
VLKDTRKTRESDNAAIQAPNNVLTEIDRQAKKRLEELKKQKK